MLEVIALAALIIILLFYRPYLMSTTKHGAPFIPTSPYTLEQTFKMLEIKEGETFYELGSGDGRVVIMAASLGAKAYGIEIDRLRVWYSRFWILLSRLSKQARIIHGNFFDTDLSSADIVFLYQLPMTNEKLMEKLNRELKKGSRVASIGFPVPGWSPVAIDNSGPVYLYIVN